MQSHTRDPAKLMTKFVKASDLKRTLKGELKFGTLESYRSAEPGAAHRLSDTGEGIAMHYTSQQLHGQTFERDGNTFNITTVDCAAPISFQTRTDCYIFCASRGPYREDLHAAMYAANNDLTHYAVFDMDKFSDAMCMLYSAAWPDREHKHFSDDVIYNEGERAYDFSPENLMQMSDAAMVRDTIFRKPGSFRHEEEVRFVMMAGTPAGSVFVKDYPRQIAKAFAAAVVRSGCMAAPPPAEEPA